MPNAVSTFASLPFICSIGEPQCSQHPTPRTRETGSTPSLRARVSQWNPFRSQEWPSTEGPPAFCDPTCGRAIEQYTQRTRAVIHDLRGPLTTISLVGQRLESDTGDARRLLGILQAETRRMDGMLQGLLDQLRMENSLEQLHLRPLAPSEVLSGLLAGFQIRAEAANLQFCAEDRLPVTTFVMGDIQALQQLVLNLVGNALKFTERGSVRLSSFQAESSWCLEVADTGRGMETEALERLFSPFRQAESRDLGQGWGLGLSIVQSIVERHRGSIEVASRPGQGSRFRVLIPLA